MKAGNPQITVLSAQRKNPGSTRTVRPVKQEKHLSDQEEQRRNMGRIMDGARIISYNFTERERPGGMKIRAKIRVVSGKQAETVSAAQAEAIRELLVWVRQHRSRQQQP
jgi:hypothetical protein